MSKLKKVTHASVTLEQAQDAAQTFSKASNRLSTIEALINKQMEAIRSKYQAEITEQQELATEQMPVLEAYAIANKESWPLRSYELTHARIGFRYGNKKVDKLKGVTWDAVLAFVEASKPLAKLFVRTKKELDKTAILAADDKLLAKLEASAKIIITQDETFFVEERKEAVA